MKAERNSGGANTADLMGVDQHTRDGFWLRPRTDEQFAVLLEGLTGMSSNRTEELRLPRVARAFARETVKAGSPQTNAARNVKEAALPSGR